MDMIQHELKRRGLKMRLLDEPEEQHVVNEDEAPKDREFDPKKIV